MDITIEDLQSYRFWESEVNSIDDEIDTIYSHLPTTGRESTGARSSEPGDPTAFKAAKIDALRRRQSALIQKIAAVDAWLNRCEDNELVSICRYHYAIGLSWKQTARLVYSGMADESRARKKVGRYFG